ncbi:TPA_asm: fusion protein [Melilotus officinalis amalgavirus 1]|nr:TPA_asm: fusion protein [Melilotus officinalis amalgavirus 1]
MSAAREVMPLRVTVDLQPDLNAVLGPLAACGFRCAAWTVDHLAQNYANPKQFISGAKMVCQFEDEDTRNDLCALGITHGFFTSQRSATPSQMLKFFNFLKGKDGSQVLASFQKKLSLAKKAAPGLDIRLSSLVSMAQFQLNELNTAVKEKRQEIEDTILELRRAINLLQEDLKNVKELLDDDYLPMFHYEPQDDSDLINACYRRYCADAAAAQMDAEILRFDIYDMLRARYGDAVRQRHLADWLNVPERENLLKLFIDQKVKMMEEVGDVRQASNFVSSWKVQVENWLLRFELKQRQQLLRGVVIGKTDVKEGRMSTLPISCLLDSDKLRDSAQSGIQRKPPMPKKMEALALVPSSLSTNLRISILRQPQEQVGGSIPHARSRFEAKVRRVIGGGEMRTWAIDTNKYRGGGNFSDALKLLIDARTDLPGSYLDENFSVNSARASLLLPSGLPVPDGSNPCKMKNFNNDATAGPCLRAFGLRRKAGLKEALENFAWDCYNEFARCGSAVDSLPFICARVGYRTKLSESGKALEKVRDGKPLGRCVMMLDAYEQAFSSPLYNVLSSITNDMKYRSDSSFRNTTVRASSDWGKMWGEVQAAKCIVELDWKKFDRERPARDISFVIEVILSCFEPKSPREERLLTAYGIMLRRALLERHFVTDCGGAFHIDGMVPSGSLWTGWLDTALNILYLRAVSRYLCIPDQVCLPKCAGDDNLTLFLEDVPDEKLLAIKGYLNDWFRAGIEDEDFLIHRPPFGVSKVQARFPPGTDLSKGTSGMLDEATWVPFEGDIIVDQPRGWSHRWKYVFEGRPKFLSCYWLENGNPIRPTYINAEKLLWPEGIHDSLDDYESALIGMVVDNPFNHHNINHLMHRYCIVRQVRRLEVTGIQADHILSLSKYRGKPEEPVPYPMVAFWRRTEGYVDMDVLPDVRRSIQEFEAFVQGVTSLYCRHPSGGIDAWRFMEMIRLEVQPGEGQFGNDLTDWIDFLKAQPATKYLKPLKQYRIPLKDRLPQQEALRAFQHFQASLAQLRGSRVFASVENFTEWISDNLRLDNKKKQATGQL